jgi:Fms-interacting protein/Thoc5
VCAPPDPEVDTPASLHKAHPQFVCVDLHDVDSGGRAAASSTKARRSPHKRTRGGPLHNGDAAAAAGQTLLSLTFRYHPSLNVVTVGCAHDDNLSRVTVDDLVVLYPFDYGVQSPNPANAFLLDGAFAFDRSRVPNNGRPFVWANMLCGLYYPGFIKGNVERHRSTIPESFLEWSEYARSFPTHLRFVEVLNAVRRRVASKRSLQEQFETLQTLQLPLTWRQVGLAEAPNATLKVFHVLPPEQNWAAYGISTMPSSEKNITACAFHVEHSGGVALVGMVGIQRDYPATKGLFRLKCHADSAWKVPEPVIRQLECDVNVFGHEDEAGPDGVDARSKGKDRRGSVSRSPVRAAPRAGSSGAGGAGASSVDAATMAHVNGRPGGPGAPVVPGAGEGRGSRAGGISDDMTLSMQMVKLLSCVDKLASDCARADAEEAPGANFHEDPMSWRGRGGGVDGGDDDVGDSPPERTTRKTRGRARSRKFAS